MNPLDSARQQLTAPTRQRFLVVLAQQLTITARAASPEAGTPLPQGTTALRGHNELLHTILGKLAADLAHTPSYPDDVFLRILVDKAQLHGCTGELHWAMRTASLSTTDPPPQP